MCPMNVTDVKFDAIPDLGKLPKLKSGHQHFSPFIEGPLNDKLLVSALKVYFFNLTNAEAVFKGLEKPKLVEVGPYTYTQKWTKQNITWHENGTLSYRTRKIFT